jgi:hypothetical protein
MGSHVIEKVLLNAFSSVPGSHLHPLNRPALSNHTLNCGFSWVPHARASAIQLNIHSHNRWRVPRSIASDVALQTVRLQLTSGQAATLCPPLIVSSKS